MLLSIIIVNYKSAALINNCITSLVVNSGDLPYELLLVDNASEDESCEILSKKFPFIHWVQMNYNSGFARANNEGIRRAKGDAVLLLNPDTLCTDTSLRDCYFGFKDSTYVACGVQLLNEDGTPQISGNYAMKGGLNYLLPLPYLGALIKAVATLCRVKKPNVPDTHTTTEVDWINGAFLMVKKAVIEKAGLLDEDFFLYAEEAEWCSRLKKYGKLCIYGQYSVIHLQGEVSNDAFNTSGKGYYNLYDKRGLQIMLSNLVRIRKQFGVGWFVLILLAYTFEIPFFLAAGIIHQTLRLQHSIHLFKRWFGFTKNVFYVWSKCFVIISNQPYFYKVL